MSIFFYYLLLAFFLPLCHCTTYYGKVCSDRLRSGSLNHSNIHQVLASLVSDTPDNKGFGFSSYGRGNQTIYGGAECLGDITNKSCSSCLASAAKRLLIECSSCLEAAGGIIWYDLCYMRYSSTNYFGQLVKDGYQIIRGTSSNASAANADAFYKEAWFLMKSLIDEADIPEFGLRSKGNLTYKPSSQTIYGMAQCMWDLVLETCNKCLYSMLFHELPDHCRGKSGCVIYNTNCFLRFEVFPFYNK